MTNVDLQGDISGQVAIGQHILQVGHIHGGVVNLVAPDQCPRLTELTTPISLLPRRFDDLVGRDSEIKRTIATLQYAQPVEFYGCKGVGKSVLMRHLTHKLKDNPSFPDGIISKSLEKIQKADFLQLLFESFYKSDIPFIPDETKVIHLLHQKKSLILLDNISFERNELDSLMNSVVPNSTFLMTSTERHLWGEGHAQNLQGLEPKEALSLVEREWGQPLTPEEQKDAYTLCVLLDGHPLDILQATALAKVERQSLTAVVQKLTPATAQESLRQESLKPLKKKHRWLLALLAALFGLALAAEQATDLSAMPVSERKSSSPRSQQESGIASDNLSAYMEELCQRKLVEKDGDRYRLANNLTNYLEQKQDLKENSDFSDNYIWAFSMFFSPSYKIFKCCFPVLL